jgi:hypothetical protein
MKIKNKDLIMVAQGLEHLSSEHTVAWYCVNKNKRKVKPFIEEFEQSRRDVMDKMADRNEDGSIKTKVENGVEVLDISDPIKAKEIEDAMLAIAEEEIEIEFHIQPVTVIVNESHLPQYIEPLIGTVFID